MLICNNKFVLNHTLNPSTFIYNPDDGQLIFKQGDPRNKPTIKYKINNGTVQTGSFDGTYLKLPSYDTEYSLDVEFIPTNSKYTGNSTSGTVFMNNPACKNFIYNSKYGNEVIEYQGTDGTIVVPSMHNMVRTTKLSLTEFPTVSSSSITIETPESITDINIPANSKITGLTLNGLINSTTRQFANFSNLKTFTGKLSSVSERMFENDSKLTTATITNATLAGTYGFKGCSALTTVNMPNLTTVHSHAFENCSKLTGISLDKCLTVGDYGFAGCTSLNLDASALKNINVINPYAFYDTRMKTIRLKTSTLPIGCFDFSGNPFERIIFTSSLNINGLDNNTLMGGTYTDGMLYNGNKKHQVYCGVNDSNWEDSPISSSSLTASMTSSQIKVVGDKNTIGLKVEFRTLGGISLGGKFAFPGDTGVSSSKSSSSKTFTLNTSSILKMNGTVSRHTGYSKEISSTALPYMFLDGTIGKPDTLDMVYIESIDKNGLKGNKIGFFMDGSTIDPKLLEGYTPKGDIKKAFYKDGAGYAASSTTYKISGYSGWSYSSSKSDAGKIWLTGIDPNYTKIMFFLRTHQSGASTGKLPLQYGLNNKYLQKVDVSTLPTATAGDGTKFYILNLSNYYSDTVLGYAQSYRGWFAAFYDGFPNKVWRFDAEETSTYYPNSSSHKPTGEYYIASFDYKDGKNSFAEVAIDKGSSGTMPTPKWSGHTFQGWYDEEGNYIGMGGESISITKNSYFYAEWAEGSTPPPAKLPDTTSATIPIEKAFCNMSSSSISGTLGTGGSSLVTTINSKYLYLVQNPTLTVRAELYDPDGYFVDYYDLSPRKDFADYDYPDVVGYYIGSMEGVTNAHTLKCYYKNNPSFGEFTITLTTKKSYY